MSTDRDFQCGSKKIANYKKVVYSIYYFITLKSRKPKRSLNMGKTVHTEAVQDLFEAILTLETEEECFNFFEDVCTVNELLSIAQRFAVAKMLKEDNTYLEVAEKTGASTATISRVNRSLNYGKDGYELVFSRMKSFQQNDKQDDKENDK